MEVNMKAQELTKEIYDKYPKVWEQIENIVNGDNINTLETGHEHPYIIYNYDYIGYLNIFPFNMLYGLLVNFFDEKRIIISVTCELYNVFEYDVLLDSPMRFISDNKEYKTRQEAQLQAILKACEILEGAL
jgi:hypothetical protein